jgi:hypothetical protein
MHSTAPIPVSSNVPKLLGRLFPAGTSRILRVSWRRVLMKQNITLAVERHLLKKARAFAAERGTSVSAMLADELHKIVARETVYEQARAKAMEQLSHPFRLGGGKIANREALHDRHNLR